MEKGFFKKIALATGLTAAALTSSANKESPKNNELNNSPTPISAKALEHTKGDSTYQVSADDFKFHAKEEASYFEHHGERSKSAQMELVKGLPDAVMESVNSIINAPENSHIDFSDPRYTNKLIAAVEQNGRVAHLLDILAQLSNGQMGTPVGANSLSVDSSSGTVKTTVIMGNPNVSVDMMVHDYFNRAPSDLVREAVIEALSHKYPHFNAEIAKAN